MKMEIGEAQLKLLLRVKLQNVSPIFVTYNAIDGQTKSILRDCRFASSS